MGAASQPTSEVAPAVLADYGAVCRNALQGYLAVQGDRGAEYLGAAIRDYPGRGGRSLRASLCIAVARAFGAATEDAVRTAAALEMLHNAFLIHDDIEDASLERRGHPTLHLLHGVPIAINVGDALTVLSLRPLLENRDSLGLRVTLRVLEEAERMARETVEGQAIELGWRRVNAVDLGEQDYLRMVLKKTCWYTMIFPLRVGALIGTRDGLDLDEFLRFGFFLGAAFQIQDDVLNLIGDPKRYGKELAGDLREGKRTLIVIHAMNQASPDERARLTDFFSLEPQHKQEQDIRWVRELIDRHDSIEYARHVAHGLAGAASLECERLFRDLPEGRDLQFVRELPSWVIRRS
ncbi:MAG: polyprenyl synthetase family protein [Polyangiaceae bacterium]